ncbi:hypothetical protein [Streptomyces sp. NPDC002994]|uniref:DUF3885 domain-containing protein n=1 Tax=Streptomyces sp. NPDC002994 TaxID=3154441 RepID=UPI0033B2DD90
MSPGFAPEALAARWGRERWPPGPPIAHEFRGRYADRWVRFHSLPGSKRYPETEAEYAIVLDRYNSVLDELFAGVDVFVVTADWSTTPTGPAAYPSYPPYPTREALHPEGVRWWTEANQEAPDPDPDFHTHTHLYADRRPWERGCADALLRAVADEELGDVFFTDTELRRIHHPYDGGADVILSTPAERDRLRGQHTDWLSSHASGL